jgi:hypothetical protein
MMELITTHVEKENTILVILCFVGTTPSSLGQDNGSDCSISLLHLAAYLETQGRQPLLDLPHSIALNFDRPTCPDTDRIFSWIFGHGDL